MRKKKIKISVMPEVPVPPFEIKKNIIKDIVILDDFGQGMIMGLFCVAIIELVFPNNNWFISAVIFFIAAVLIYIFRKMRASKNEKEKHY